MTKQTKIKHYTKRDYAAFAYLAPWIIGMLILFVLLALQILPAKWVNPGCYVLIRYMALLFVPIGVGVMQYFDLLRAQFGPVVVSCAVSTLVVFLVVSWSSQLVHGERKVVGHKGSEE